MDNPVTLDFSTAQPVDQTAPAQQQGGVSLDFSTAQPVHQGMSDEEIQHEVAGLPHHGVMDSAKNAIHATYDVARESAVGGLKGAGQGLLDADNLIRHGLNHMGAHYQDVTPQDFGASSPDALKPTDVQSFGYGGETLLEFLMGEEAVKGLSLADKLAQSARVAKILEKSPRAMQALKLGASASKAMAELGPEEREALRKSPVLSRLAGAGMDAIRSGSVQGAQTFLHSGGDAGKAGKDALSMGGTSFALGAPLAGLGGLLSKGGDAAKTVQEMSAASTSAPSESGLASSLGDAISSERDKIDSTLESETTEAAKRKAGGLEGADADREARQLSADQTAETRRTTGREGVAELAQKADAGLEDAQQTATTSLLKATNEAHQTLLDSLASVSHNAMNPKELAEAVNEGINQTEAQTHKLYEESINSILDRLDGSKVAVSDSPLAKRAQELLREPMPDDHAAVALAKKGSGNTIGKDVRTLLESLATGQVPKEGAKKAGKAAAGEAVEEATKPMSDWTADSLIKLRQEIRQWSSGYMRGDINARSLTRLLPAIDDTLGKLADQSGDPEVVNLYGRLRSAYRQAREVLDSNTADKLNLQRPDQAMNDVGKYLLGGANPSAKIKTLSRIVGDGTMQEIAKSKVQQLQRLAATDPTKFLKEWNKIPDEVKQDFFGNQLAGNVQQAADTYSKSADTAVEAHRAALTAAKDENTTALSTTKNISKAHEAAVNAEYKTALETSQAKYKSAVDGVKKMYDLAVQQAKDAHGTASEPFRGTFMKQLSEGKVNDALLKGNVDIQDIRKVKQVIGDSKWQDIGDGVFQRAIADSSPQGRFDPGKMMEWWKGITPDVRREMFSFNPAKYDSAVEKVKDAASFQRLVKAGVLVTGGTAASKGLSHIGPLAEAVAVVSGVAGRDVVRKLIDWVANHPTTWKTMAGLSKAANSPTADAANRLIRYGAGRAVMNGASSALGGNQ